jgi:hypothetical protein
MALSGEFQVPANSDTGVDFTNTESTELVYTFSSSGFWTPVPSNPYMQGFTAEGFPALPDWLQNYYKSSQDFQNYLPYRKYPNHTLYALVAENKNTGAVTEVGKKMTIVIKPGETFRFILNSFSWEYANNGGSITVNWSASKMTSKVMAFDGDDDFIILPPMNIDWSEGLTLEAWVNAKDLDRSGYIIALGEEHPQDYINFSHSGKTNDKLDLWFKVNNRTGEPIKYKSLWKYEAIVKDTWTHIAATNKFTGKYGTLNPKIGEGILYVNGEKAATVSDMFLPFNIERRQNAIGGVYSGSPDWVVSDFAGKLAEIRIWKRARSQEEIKADMRKRLTGREPGLAAYWPLNEVTVEGQNLKVLDRASNYHGTVKAARLVEDTTFPFA